ncbi:MAG: hypothetical protein LLG45_00080 [Actinomycetia bacterium]|nr:hypothetical protein [Actinomycetes bacterium]
MAAVDKDSVVIPDDHHCIESPALHAGIAFLVDHMPAHMRPILAGQVDPPLLPAHYRPQGPLLETGADDLRFTLDKTASLLREVMGVQPAPEDIAAPCTRRVTSRRSSAGSPAPTGSSWAT